jgi:hypothetical protein
MVYIVLDETGELLATLDILTQASPPEAWQQAIDEMDPNAMETRVLASMAVTFHCVH